MWDSEGPEGSETEGTIPKGWRLATKEEAIWATKHGACFQAKVLVFQGFDKTKGCAVRTKAFSPEGEVYNKFLVGKATNGGDELSVVKTYDSALSKKFLLVKIGKLVFKGNM